MKRLSNIYIVLFILFFLGFILRFYRLGEVPVGLHRDEAFLGYNAYSILLTGKDMNSNLFPLHLKSFLFSPAGYSYLSIPFIYFFGLSTFSVRFVSAFFGSLFILLVFFLAKELFRNYKNKNIISLLSSFFIAISPWNINLARTATENTIVVFLITLGTLLFLLSVRKNNFLLLILSFLSYGITLFLYQAPRAFLPLFIPLLVFFLLPKIKNKKERLAIFFLFLSVIIAPLLTIFASKNLSLRIRTVSVFATSETKLKLDQYIREDGVRSIPSFTARFFHNKVIGYSQEILNNYFEHFSYKFLFTDSGFPDRYRVPSAGLLYVYELPLILLGVWELFKRNKRTALFIIGWIILAPLGSALTFDDVPNLQRTLIIFPAISFLAAFGVVSIYGLLNSLRVNKYTIYIPGILIVVYFLSFYLHQYYIHQPVYRPWYRQDGYKELVVEVNKFLGKNEKAIVTNRESAPTIFFLFYSKYSPIEFQKETKNTKMKDFDRINFLKYNFSQEECPLKLGENGEIKKEKNTVFVNSGLCKEIFNAGEIQIKRLDGSIAFRMYPSN